jgi:nitroreductase
MDYLEGLLSRRSVAPKDMTDERVLPEHLEIILKAATRVPDHGKLAPWHIKVLDKAAQVEFGSIVSGRFEELNPGIEDKFIIFERERATRAPLLLVVMTQTVQGKIPPWEQYMSAGAVCMNILHAAHALGYGAKWLTEWIAYDEKIIAAIGARPGERIAGFIYIGTPKEKPADRERPDLAKVVSHWKSRELLKES